MLKSLHIRNFTVFGEAQFEFGPGLNVLVGANGTGKSHALKLGYSVGTAAARMTLIKDGQLPFYSGMPEFAGLLALSHEAELITSLAGVFHTRNFAKLQRTNTLAATEIAVRYDKPAAELSFLVAASMDNPLIVHLQKQPVEDALLKHPLFVPAKEVLSFYEGFSALYRKYNLAFDQTYLDLCEALSGPTLREPGPGTSAVLTTLERLMQGRVALEGGRFYLYSTHGERQEMNLAAEGIRKFATLAQLVANGSLSPESTLFWDEPEANLNPALLKELAKLLFTLADQGFQIIIATHSLFLLKEFHILAQQQQTKLRYFGLSAPAGEATQVMAADDLTLLPDIVALDAELAQSDIFVEVLNAADNAL